MLDLEGKPRAASTANVPIQSVDKPSYVTYIGSGALIVLVVGFTALIYFLTQAEKQKYDRLTNGDYQTLTSELAKPEYADLNTKAQGVIDGVKVLRQANTDTSLIWSDFLKTVQKTTSPGVKLNTFSVDEQGTVKIDGEGMNYQDVANFIATLRSETATYDRVELIGTSILESKESGALVQFTLALTLKNSSATTARAS